MVTGRISLTAPEYSPISSGGQRRARDQLVLPLPRADGVGDEDQRGGLGVRHRGRADDGLAGAAGQHDDAGPAVPERLGGLALVGPQRPAVLGEVDRVRLAVDVAGEVLGRPAELEQRLLEVAALAGVHGDGVVVEPRADHPGDLLGAQHLLEHRAVGATRAPGRGPGASRGGAGRSGPSSRRRRRAARAGRRTRLHVSSASTTCSASWPGGARVPEAERGEPVGVDVLGRALELGEGRDRLAGLARPTGGRPRAGGSCRTGRSGGRRSLRTAAFWRARKAATLAREEHRSEQ